MKLYMLKDNNEIVLLISNLPEDTCDRIIENEKKRGRLVAKTKQELEKLKSTRREQP